MKEEIVIPDKTFDIELEKDLLLENEKIAGQNRELLKEKRVKSIEIMGSIGSGKTTLIEQLSKRLNKKYKIAVFNGDLTTAIDAERVKKHDVKVVQINTGRECHLDADLIRKALQKVDLNALDLLIVENVGNLICPAEFPLGCEKRVVVISVTEGPYMVVKHPFIFSGADVVVINKKDLARKMKVSVKKLESDVKKINHRVKVIAANCRKGEGVAKVIRALEL